MLESFGCVVVSGYALLMFEMSVVPSGLCSLPGLLVPNVDSTVWLHCLPGLFLLILGHVGTSVFCSIVPLFPYVC
jgi:hypothetical protein